MRIDVVTIFPDYFAPAHLSLLGKAHEVGLVSLRTHDLRDWTTDKHRTVDDTPFGGGAGMVMRPDVWGRALDEILSAELSDSEAGERRVLAIPTPSGIPLTQALAEDLVGCVQLAFACGRYEGIDQRVADHYRETGIEVIEYSIGDYVLNGGEVAALVLIEAVTRLLDGFMGNPDSLVEESHSNGLLEYPAYTKPRSWAGRDVPDVLLGGNHAAIAAWRRERALERTAARRPDLVAALDAAALDAADKETLVRCGFVRQGDETFRVDIRFACADEVDALAQLAARTFPDACPPELAEDAIAEHIEAELSVEVISGWIADPQVHRVLVADVEGELAGYSLTLVSGADLPDDMIRPGRIDADAAYLSKCYADVGWRGTGIADALIEAAVEDARAHCDARQIVVGTNCANERAQRFYRRHGFKKKGRRTFYVAGVANRDAVLVRNFTAE